MRKTLFLILILAISSVSGYKQILYGDYNPSLFSKYIDVPVLAVSADEKSGIQGWLRIAFIEGNGNNVVFDGRTNVDTTTIESVLNAVEFAESYLNEQHDYFFSYDLKTEKVSGGSTGSSIASGIIALAQNKTMKNNTIITGEVDYDGNLIETGGIPLKVAVASVSGHKTLFLPENSSQYTLIEKHVAGSSVYYVSKELNMTDYAKSIYNMELSECPNLKLCLNFILQ
jgi:predicted S18 family serine protease